MGDFERDLAEAVESAYETGSPVRIAGSGSKAFHIDVDTNNLLLDATCHSGVVSYEPSELVLTAWAGTPLSEIESLLASHGQMLACEPPHFGPKATLGGTLACGFSGPRRPYAGSLRDFVLGTRIINGRGDVLRFGGQVMKNVAGFDVSRLMVGAQGTLGLLLEASLKVLPRPAFELTLQQSSTQQEAIARCAAWAGKPLPISAAAWLDGLLTVRLSGAQTAVTASANIVGGDPLSDADVFWEDLREHRLSFFALQPGETLWQLSLPPASPPLAIDGRTCLDWGGAQRWLVSSQPDEAMFSAARSAGGHATLFRSALPTMARARFTHEQGIALLHQQIKSAFDPAGILNPGNGFGAS
jgi:glycolate oxidase FAD binding subunit